VTLENIQDAGLPLPLFRRLAADIQAGDLVWGASRASDWLASLDDAELGRVCEPDQDEVARADLLAVTLTLLLMETGAPVSASVPRAEIEAQVNVLLVIASLVRLDRAGLFRLENRLALSDPDEEIELRITAKGRWVVNAPLN
jgi:hypothetical protein